MLQHRAGEKTLIPKQPRLWNKMNSLSLLIWISCPSFVFISQLFAKKDETLFGTQAFPNKGMKGITASHFFGFILEIQINSVFYCAAKGRYPLRDEGYTETLV